MFLRNAVGPISIFSCFFCWWIFGFFQAYYNAICYIYSFYSFNCHHEEFSWLFLERTILKFWIFPVKDLWLSPMPYEIVTCRPKTLLKSDSNRFLPGKLPKSSKVLLTRQNEVVRKYLSPSVLKRYRFETLS